MQKTMSVMLCLLFWSALAHAQEENFCQTYMDQTQDFLTVRVHGPNGVDNQLQTLRYSGHIGKHPASFVHGPDAWLTGKDLINFKNYGGSLWVENQYREKQYHYNKEPYVDFYRTFGIQDSSIPRIFSFDIIVDGKVCDCRVGRHQKMECNPRVFPVNERQPTYGICHYILDHAVDRFSAVAKQEYNDLYNGYLHKKQGMLRFNVQTPEPSNLIPIRYLDFCGYTPQHTEINESFSNHALPFEAIDFHFGYQGVLCECAKDYMTDEIRCLSNMD